jgi:hypothetical protein
VSLIYEVVMINKNIFFYHLHSLTSGIVISDNSLWSSLPFDCPSDPVLGSHKHDKAIDLII